MKRRYYGKIEYEHAGLRREVDREVARELSKEVETKVFIASATPQSMVQTGAAYHVSAVPQGDGNQERVGDEIVCKKLRFKYHLRSNGEIEAGGLITVPLATNIARVLVLRWAPVASTPTISDILEDGTVDATNNVFLPYKSGKPAAFEILYDRTHVLHPTATRYSTTPYQTGLVDQQFHEVAIDLRGKRINYSDWTSGVAGIGRIFLFYLGNYNPGASSYPNIQFVTQLSYSDA